MGLLFVNVWRGVCLLAAIFSRNITAAQDITVERIEPDPTSQPFPCPNQTVVYKCRVLIETNDIAWVLPTNDSGPLRFLGIEMRGMNRSTPDGRFIATLTGSVQVAGSDPPSYFINSTLQIQPPLDILNGSSVTCAGGILDAADEEGIEITVSGTLDPPQQLQHIITANTESSAVIQWRSPLYTGGPIISYTVTVNGQSTSVSGDVFTYTITGLDVNTEYAIGVTAVNLCGLESEPANVTVNIQARVPPPPALLPTALHCDVPLEDGRPVVITWMYGSETEEEGVVYPGEVGVRVDLDPGDVKCSDVTADDTNCTVNITRNDNYTVSLTLSNDVGSTQPVQSMFNSTPLVTIENKMPTFLTVCPEIQVICRIANYTIIVVFGVTKSDGDCDFSNNETMTARSVKPGDRRCFEVNITVLPLSPGEQFCYNVLLLGDTGTLDMDTDSGGGGLSPGAIAGIVLAAVAIPGSLILIILLYCRHLKNTDQGSEQVDLRKSGQASPEVEECPPATTELGVTYQDPTTITRTPHPSTGEVYTDVKLDKKKREKVEVGPMYQDPSTIEHQQATSGDTYALPQKGKKGKKGTKGEVGEGERELTEEEKAGMYSTPDRKGQKAKSDGLTYARLDMQPTSKKAPPPAGSMYVDLQHPN